MLLKIKKDYNTIRFFEKYKNTHYLLHLKSLYISDNPPIVLLLNQSDGLFYYSSFSGTNFEVIQVLVNGFSGWSPIFFFERL
jgi:hypothetical protein